MYDKILHKLKKKKKKKKYDIFYFKPGKKLKISG